MRFRDNSFVSSGITQVRFLCLFCLLLQPFPSIAQDSMQPLLQRLSSQGKLQIAGVTVYDLTVTQELYAKAAYAPIWTSPEAVKELSDSIEQAWREGMSPDDYRQSQVQALRDGSLSLDTTERDLLLTDSLIRITYHYALGKLEPKDYVSSWNFNRVLPEVDPVDWLGEVIKNGGITAGLGKLKPSGAMYQNLITALARYRAISANGGWVIIPEGPTLRKGDSGPRVAQLRLRLQAEGDLEEGHSAAPDDFDGVLEKGVIRFQRRHRLDDDGVVGKQTLVALNVPVDQRIGQIRVNLERARVLQDIPATAVIVDIAGFEVSFFRDGRRLLRSRAQVGRPYRSTPVFRENISYIEFNPTWTVPPTILVKDVLPAIKRDPGYLKSRNMQVLTVDGKVVDPGSVKWQEYPQRGFPYLIRQQPGPANALGRVKVMFPNEHMVYLHDTPSRELFNRSERTLSSGCIRVEKIEELVELLLDDPQQWNPSAINAAIETRKTRRVSLANPVPVYLVYWTVQVEEDGEVHFKRDSYGLDRQLLKALEQPLVPEAARVGRIRSQK
jgi:murein L,D-transpeptidase YcbB/YkuD